MLGLRLGRCIEWVTVLPPLSVISCVAPDCDTAQRVSAVVVVANACMIMFSHDIVPVRSHAIPVLATASRASHILESSVAYAILAFEIFVISLIVVLVGLDRYFERRKRVLLLKDLQSDI